MSPRFLLSLLSVVALLLASCGGTERDAISTTASDGLPVSDEGSGDQSDTNDIGSLWGPSPSPALEVFDDPPEELVGALVATANVTEGEVEVWETRVQTEPTWSLPVPTEFGGLRHFLVLEERDDWLKIAVPVRPNETVGWIPRADVTLSITQHRVQIDISDRTLKVWENDELILDTTSAVGRDSDPTPLGAFYIRDVLAWDPNSVYGPYVLALSAYSETIDQINGGDAVVAIHGTSSPTLLGSAVSLGCIRLANEDVTLLAETVPVGTPVEIVA